MVSDIRRPYSFSTDPYLTGMGSQLGLELGKMFLPPSAQDQFMRAKTRQLNDRQNALAGLYADDPERRNLLIAGQNIDAIEKARGLRAGNSRLSDMWANADTMSQGQLDRRGVIAGLYNPNQSYYSVDADNATKLAQTGMNNRTDLTKAAMAPLGQGYTQDLPPGLAYALGLPQQRSGIAPTVTKNQLVPVAGVDGKPTYQMAADAVGAGVPEGGNSPFGRYHVVPSGAGLVRVDRTTGAMDMLAVGPDGNLVVAGSLGQGAAPAGVQPGPAGAQPGPAAPPAASPPVGAAPAPAAARGTPLLPPSVDPRANAAKAAAVEEAKAALKNKWSANADYNRFMTNFGPLDRLAKTATFLRDSPDLPKITGMLGVLPNIPGGGAADTQAQLSTLKSQIRASVVQMYRDMSKTGGAVGNVSDNEQKAFEENLAALDTTQSPEAMRASLNRILDFVSKSKARLQAAYEREHLNPGVVPVPPQQGSPEPAGPAGGVTFLGFE